MPAIVAALTFAVSLSSHLAGAHPVAIGLRLTYAMQCGWPGPKLVTLFPIGERLPARVPRAAVLVNGKPAFGVSRTGRTLTISIARPAGAQCDVIAPGTTRVEFTPAAGLGNPSRPGTYPISVRHGTLVLRSSFSIH